MELKDPQRVWLSRTEATTYVQRVFPNLTENSLDHAAYKRRTLHRPNVVSRTAFYHRDWLDAWLKTLGATTDPN